jgi:hypothetical protein
MLCVRRPEHAHKSPIGDLVIATKYQEMNCLQISWSLLLEFSSLEHEVFIIRSTTFVLKRTALTPVQPGEIFDGFPILSHCVWDNGHQMAGWKVVQAFKGHKQQFLSPWTDRSILLLISTGNRLRFQTSYLQKLPHNPPEINLNVLTLVNKT